MLNLVSTPLSQQQGNHLQPNLRWSEMLGSCRLPPLPSTLSWDVKMSFQIYPKNSVTSHWTSAGWTFGILNIDTDSRVVIILLGQALCHTVRKMEQSIQSDRLCRLIPDTFVQFLCSSSLSLSTQAFGHSSAFAFPREAIAAQVLSLFSVFLVFSRLVFSSNCK